MQKVPKYRVRVIRGRRCAVVAMRDRETGQRREFYLGLAGSPESQARYARLLLAYSRHNGKLPPRRVPSQEPITGPTVAVLVRDFLADARRRVSPSMIALYNMALGLLLARYADLPAAHLRPVHLRELREDAIARTRVLDPTATNENAPGDSAEPEKRLEGNRRPKRRPWTRETANRAVRLIVTAYRWAATHDLAPVGTYELLRAIEPMRTDPDETEPVGPVDPAVVEKTLAHVPKPVAFLARFQLLTGARPAEACHLRPCDLSMPKRGAWTYTPPNHKNRWRGKRRTIIIGPKARKLLADWLADCPTQQTLAVTGRGKPYSVALYRRTIARACLRHGLEHWHPNQLRHTYATAVRSKYGLEAAQLALGHAHADVTEIYAERLQAVTSPGSTKARTLNP